ncbi:MAG: flagellar protein FlgN [Gallionella sp.]|nr:flagellar protein FlgN [Gallionella sp.]
MDHPSCPELLTALTEELRVVRSFADLLRQEQRLLTENGIDQLPALAEQKSTYALQLNEISEGRRRLLQKSLPVLENAAIQAWLTKNCAPGLALWQEIRVMAEQAQQLNHINGELIQMKLRHNQQTLTVLSNAVNKAHLYGPDGQTSFTPGSGRSLGNV